MNRLKIVSFIVLLSLVLPGCKVEVPEISQEMVDSLVYSMELPETSVFSWAPPDMWQAGIHARLYPSKRYPAWVYTIRDLMVADGLLIDKGGGKSELNPAKENLFVSIEGDRGIYNMTTTRLIDYKVEQASEGTAKFYEGEEADPSLFRDVTYRFVKEPTELGYKIPRYDRLRISLEQKSIETLNVYKSGYTFKYNPDTKQWIIYGKINAVYPTADGTTIPYECPYE